jgi:multicomponent Na+:H+ antiporter subunit F
MHAVPDGIHAFALAALALSALMVFIRLVRGPTLSDRVAAVDMLAFLAIGFLAVHSLGSDSVAFLDAAVVLALFAFLATAAFARHVERSARGPEEQE